MDFWFFFALCIALCIGLLVAGMFIGADVHRAGFDNSFQCTESAVVNGSAECIKYEKVRR